MIEVNKNRCIYCGGCVSVCPADALELKETYIVCNSKKCTSCGTCEKFCPAGAIEVLK